VILYGAEALGEWTPVATNVPIGTVSAKVISKTVPTNSV